METVTETSLPLVKSFEIDLESETKVDIEILKLGVDESFLGMYKTSTTRPWLDRETGEMKDLTEFRFISPAGAEFIYFGDSGFKNSFATAGIKEGDVVKVTKKEKKDMKGGRSVNQYEIYRYKVK